MRCDCCNRPLNDWEATLKGVVSGDYLNTCQKCLDGMGIDTIGRKDLDPTELPEEDEWGEDYLADFEVDPDNEGV